MEEVSQLLSARDLGIVVHFGGVPRILRFCLETDAHVREVDPLEQHDDRFVAENGFGDWLFKLDVKDVLVGLSAMVRVHVSMPLARNVANARMPGKSSSALRCRLKIHVEVPWDLVVGTYEANLDLPRWLVNGQVHVISADRCNPHTDTGSPERPGHVAGIGIRLIQR